ncbi:hypothetical protein GCM10007394_17930 [Salinibacterium amurskyense]|nr:hypothetical protein GCM10007394_17930 [Salinibacterium amurskyense]
MLSGQGKELAGCRKQVIHQRFFDTVTNEVKEPHIMGRTQQIIPEFSGRFGAAIKQREVNDWERGIVHVTIFTREV